MDSQGNVWTFYDTDTMGKMSLATGVEVSPRVYSIVRSTAPRFSDSTTSVPFGIYNTDTAHKKTMLSHARDNRRFYASSFQSKAPRFGRPWTSPVTDVVYDVDRTCNSRPATVESSIQRSSQHYAILQSSYPRFNSKPPGEGADVMYNIDKGHKQSLFTAMLGSPLQYRNMGAQPACADVAGHKPHRRDHQQLLGPGCYDYKWPSEVRVSQFLDHRPLSSMVSGSPRFGRRLDAAGGLGLGSTWSQEKDTRSWALKGHHMSREEYLRPQYLPKHFKAKKGSKDVVASNK